VWQRALLEAVEAALAPHALLPHARHHLRNVDGAALAAALQSKYTRGRQETAEDSSSQQ
jgi:hypothetical protein